MKLHGLRKSSGAALGMIAASLFIIFSIGAFLYFTGSLIGGNHELNRASDAGILSVAKQALVQPAVALNDPKLLAYNACLINGSVQPYPNIVPIPFKDFTYGGISDQNVNGYAAIDVLTYNRCAAQAVIVAFQAERINTTLARQHAQAVVWAVLGIGATLQQKFGAGALNQYFETNANANTLNMLGRGSTVSLPGNLQSAYIGSGRPSNIYFYWDVICPNPAEIPAVSGQVPQNTNAADPKPNQTAVAAQDPWFPAGTVVPYASGYSPIVVMTNTPQQSIISFIPNNPQKAPHLIDAGRTTAGLLPPLNNFLSWVPPNAFLANAQAEVNITASAAKKTSNFVNAISCAMIGCGDALIGGGGPQDQSARIPGGFIRVVNLPGMEAVPANSLPLGPIPGGTTAAVSYDASGFVLNNSALGSNDQSVYMATPIPSDLSKVVFGTGTAGKKALQNWLTFNNSRVAVGSPTYNSDVVTVNGVKQHRDIKGDILLNSGTGMTVAQTLAAGKNPLAVNLYQGSGAGQKASLTELITITGYILVDSSQLDGVTPLSVMNGAGQTTGATVVNTTAIAAVTSAVGTNLHETPPKSFDLNVPANHQTWNWAEYVKYAVIHNFATHFDAGRYVASATQAQLKSGLKYFDWWGGKYPHRIHWSSPNNYMTDTTGSTHGLEQPSSSQFMTIDTPHNLLTMVDTQIKNTGGYQGAQYTYETLRGSIAAQVRLIWPGWSEVDVDNALSSSTLAPGKTMYLHDSVDFTGKHNLVMDTNCPQDTGLPPEGNVPNPNIEQAVDFSTQPGQYLQLDKYVINTTGDGSITAYKADANVEQEPWTNQSGSVMYGGGATLYKAVGYNNLLGELDLYSQPSQNLSVTYSNPN